MFACSRCPNIGECWERGTATFMILGDVCTRRCGFCNVNSGRCRTWSTGGAAAGGARGRADGAAPLVVTSVDRDDLPDGGAGAFADTIRAIRRRAPGCAVEVLTPDFRGQEMPLERDRRAARRLQPQRRDGAPALPAGAAAAPTSCAPAACFRTPGRWMPDVITKSGLMVGLAKQPRRCCEAFCGPARARRRGAHRRPVPAAFGGPPARGPLLASRRVRGAGARGLRARLRITSPQARSSAAPTTPTSRCRSGGHPSASASPPGVPVRAGGRTRATRACRRRAAVRGRRRRRRRSAPRFSVA